jgi:hypothetical protein
VGDEISGPAGPTLRDQALKPPQWTNRVYAAPSSNLSRSYSAGESKKLIRPVLKTSEVRRPKALTTEKSIQPSLPVPGQPRRSTNSAGSPRANKCQLMAKNWHYERLCGGGTGRKVSPNERLLKTGMPKLLMQLGIDRGGSPVAAGAQPLRATSGGTPYRRRWSRITFSNL